MDLLNLFVLDVMPTMLAKLEELYMKDVLIVPAMTKIALCLTILMNVQVFNIAKLTPSLLTNNILDDEFDLRSSRVNLVQMNTRIIDRHKHWNVLLFKEAIKVKEIKPTLNTGLKAPKELQLFQI